MYARTHAAFDPSRELVAARLQTVHGNDLGAGDPYPKDADGEHIVDEGTRRRLWVTHWANYAGDHRPTPVAAEDPPAEDAPAEDAPAEDAPLVTVEHAGGGYYIIQASWLSDPERVKGKDAAVARAEELRLAGPPPQGDDPLNIPSLSGAPVDGEDETDGEEAGD